MKIHRHSFNRRLHQLAPPPSPQHTHARTHTHFDGETTSKQNRLSFSVLGFTVQRRRSSTTTVGWSWERRRQEEHAGQHSHFSICTQVFVLRPANRIFEEDSYNYFKIYLEFLLIHQLIFLNRKPTPAAGGEHEKGHKINHQSAKKGKTERGKSPHTLSKLFPNTVDVWVSLSEMLGGRKGVKKKKKPQCSCSVRDMSWVNLYLLQVLKALLALL